MDLPDDLRIGLEETLHTTTPKSLAHLAEDLSRRYRTGDAQGKQAFLRYEEDIIAYAAYRLSATFAAIHAALTEVQKRQPDLQLHAMLDAGAGPGSVMWAATTLWPELERDQHMIAYGKRLATHARAPAIKEARWQPTHCIPRGSSLALGRGYFRDSARVGAGAFTLPCMVRKIYLDLV